jgi:ribosome recycling factor
MKLKQLALITTPEPRLLVVQPFDAGTVQDIERALKESKIGITPAVDGKIIRLPIPELSEERRKELVRALGKMAEEARVRVRSNRRTALDEAKKLKASGALTEDQLRDVIMSHLDQLSQDGKEKALEYINMLIDLEQKRLEFNRRQGLLYNWGIDESKL